MTIANGPMDPKEAVSAIRSGDTVSQDFSIEDQVALAERGCIIERCLTTPHSGKTTWEHVFDGVRAVGVERTLFSSDLGNPDYPAVEDGLALWADRLLGFGEDAVREMIVMQSTRLVGAA